MEEYNKQMKEWEEQQKRGAQKPQQTQPTQQPTPPKSKGLSDMSVTELQDAMENAIGEEDYALAAQIRDEMGKRKMKESFLLYDRELRLIRERKNLHTK